MERDSAALARMGSVLDGLVAAMGMASSVFRHRSDPERWWGEETEF